MDVQGVLDHYHTYVQILVLLKIGSMVETPFPIVSLQLLTTYLL